MGRLGRQKLGFGLGFTLGAGVTVGANLLCTHTARGRYEAVFWSDELQVYGPGSGPMMPTYGFKWWPRLR